MKCEEVQSKLSDLDVGVLERGEHGRVREHVAECDRCRAELEELELVGELLDRTSSQSAPAEMWSRIAPQLGPRRKKWVWALAPAAGLATIVGLMFVLQMGGRIAPGTVAPVVGEHELVSVEGDEDALVMAWYAGGDVAADPAARALLVQHISRTGDGTTRQGGDQ